MNPTRPQPPSTSSTPTPQPPADLPPKQHPPQDPTPQGAGEPTPTAPRTHPAAQARERDTNAPAPAPTALQTQPPPRRPWERPTASSRPPSSTMQAADLEGGPTDSTRNPHQGRMLIMAAAAVEAAKADRFASIRDDPESADGREGHAAAKRLPITRRSMDYLAKLVEDSSKELEAGLYLQAGAHCRALLKHPNATPEQKNYAANVARSLVSVGRQAANDLDPMEVSEGLHQHAAGVEVTEGGTPGTTKIEATYSFKVTIE